MAIGLLIGATPLYGLHLVLVVGICLPLRLDAPVAYLAANISNPFIAPFLMFAEIETGSFLQAGHAADVSVAALRATGPGPYFRDMVIGTLAFAPALALVGGALTWALVWGARRLRRGAA